MDVGIILAAGKGTRFKAQGINKTAVELAGKPLVKYGTDLLDQVAYKIVVVVGDYADSVKNAIGIDPKVIYAEQRESRGTGDAARVAVEKIAGMKLNPKKAWLGYGDHMMFYTVAAASNLGKEITNEKIALALITFDCPDVNHTYGRIVRKADGTVERIVEHKDATDEQKKIVEVNAGFYCFNYNFLVQGLEQLKPSPVTGEYYLTDLINMAVNENLTVKALKIPYESVGIGVNTQRELADSGQLWSSRVRYN